MWVHFRSVVVRHGERPRHHLSGEDVVVRVDQLDLHLVLAGVNPAMSIVLLSLASAHHQGRSSTVTCRCPTRGDTPTAPGPNTCTMRRFSTRYWAQKTPSGSPSRSGGSTISLGGGSFLTPT